jgi:hypothetical protein
MTTKPGGTASTSCQRMISFSDAGFLLFRIDGKEAAQRIADLKLERIYYDAARWSADSERWRSAFRSDVDHDSEVMPISVPN